MKEGTKWINSLSMKDCDATNDECKMRAHEYSKFSSYFQICVFPAARDPIKNKILLRPDSQDLPSSRKNLLEATH